MAFNLDQNVSGGAAFAGPVQSVSKASTAAALVKGLLDVNKTDKSKKGGPTQKDRDSATFKTIMQNINMDLSEGKSQSAVAQKYATDLASLGLNEDQKALVEQTVGSEVFARPKTKTVSDARAEIFNEAPAEMRLGLIEEEKKAALEKGETLSDSQAAQRASESYAVFQMNVNAGIIQGNMDFQKGFDQNMKSLDSFISAISKGLQVEQRGENFSLESLQKLRDGYLLFKSQPAFQKPTSKAAQDQWTVMEQKLKSIDDLFLAIEDYDSKAATAEAKRLMGTIALSGDNPLTALAVSSPEFMTKMAARISPDLTANLSTMGEIPVVDHSALEFDPVVLEAMGVAPSGQQTGDTPDGGFPVPPNPFPDTLSEDYNKMNVVTKAKSRAYHTSAITALEAGELNTPEAVNAYASSVTALSFDLTQNDRPSSKNFDVLFSNSNIARLDKLQAAGGESGRVAGQLRAQMGAALAHNQALYGVLAAGKVDSIPNIGIDTTTNKFTITDTSSNLMQEIAAVADVYYGGDFEALWKDGGSARLVLKNRLANEGRIQPDTPEYERFLAATNVLDSSLWRGLAGQYSKVRGIPERLQKFRDVGNRLKISLPEEEVAADAVDTVSNTVTQTTLPDQGTQENPFSLGGENATEDETDAAFNALPAGAFFINPADGRLLQKKG